MKIVLTEDVKNVGRAGEIVDVKPGYGRNFLIKNKLGLPGTPENIALAEAEAAERVRQFENDKKGAQELADALSKTEITVKQKAAEDGKLYGSITSKDIATALEEQSKIKVDKRKISLDAPIRHVGRIEVKIKTFAEVSGTLVVNVEAE